MPKLYRANLSFADLSRAYMKLADLIWAKYNIDTIWPKGFRKKAKGAVSVEDDE